MANDKETKVFKYLGSPFQNMKGYGKGWPPVGGYKYDLTPTGDKQFKLLKNQNKKQLLIAHNTHRSNPLTISKDNQVLYGGGNHDYREHILYDPAGNPVSIEINNEVVPYNPKNLKKLENTVKPWK